MKTKLSDLLKYTHNNIRTTNISYTWHRANGRSDRLALVLSFSKEALALARFREGDACDIEFDESDNSMTIYFGDKLPFSCYLKSKGKDSQRQIKISTKGIEAVMSRLPKNDKLHEFTILQSDVGKIRVRLPIKK
jgi:hypothetical protein